MPLPPPPAEALIMIGYPIWLAIALASSTELIAASLPGTVGTLAFFINAFAEILSPISCIFKIVGPMKVIPLF